VLLRLFADQPWAEKELLVFAASDFMRAGVPRARAENGTSNRLDPPTHAKGNLMHSIVYIVGAIVIIVALLGFFGLR
jgi:hypothetical protein